MLLQQPEVRKFFRGHAHSIPGASAFGSSPEVRYESDPATGNLPYSLGTRVPEIMSTTAFRPLGPFLHDLGHNPGSSALAGAAIGGALGAGAGLFNRQGVLRSGLMGAAAGGGGLGLISTLIRMLNRPSYMSPGGTGASVKQSSFYAQDSDFSLEFIKQKLSDDSSVGFSEKSSLLNNLSSLGSQELKSISQLLRGGMGAGAGYVIAKYLLGLGFTGTLLSTLAGGMLGFASGVRPRNAFGQSMITDRDSFGRSRFIF